MNEKDERISQIYGKYGTGLNIGREFGFKRNSNGPYQPYDNRPYQSYDGQSHQPYEDDCGKFTHCYQKYNNSLVLLIHFKLPSVDQSTEFDDSRSSKII